MRGDLAIMNDVSKADWKLFCERVPGWQESYMGRLEKEYVELLESDEPASTKFWELDKRIKEDRRSIGVIIEKKKSEVYWDVARFINDGVITKDDIADFSDDLKAAVNLFLSR